ncbi:hypothetical protein [Empedobacter sp.]|uniref:hypothetical protein n=1 Tax=Empedobacter sp. TaxID=1927715 RepID=UPI002899288B|nr:hypothetical protein [Empedobacter sp.]
MKFFHAIWHTLNHQFCYPGTFLLNFPAWLIKLLFSSSEPAHLLIHLYIYRLSYHKYFSSDNQAEADQNLIRPKYHQKEH